ncbi:MAG: DUF2914 domain-containing protein [Candidatus Paceibacterota bacterium]|jgi:hypothetical protein
MSSFTLKNLKELFDKYESHLSSATLVLGFIFDFLTLKRVDYIWDNVLIMLYLVVAGASILIINLYESGKFRNKFTSSVHEFLPFTLQFAFGGLFSAFTIFYSKSSSFVSSGMFVTLLFLLMVGNEFFKKRYQKLAFQLGIYFMAIFSFSIYFLPVLIKRMGVDIFIWSGGLSLVFISSFVLLIAWLAPLRYKESYKYIFLTIGAIWVSVNALYFLNIIPPIPLSLKTSNVYHGITKLPQGGYQVTGEPENWVEKLKINKKIHLDKGEGVYVFSSVFAPADLNIKIVHNWQYFDSSTSEWVSASRISFPIAGGRAQGYRGFSKKENIFPGAWRVDVETERGQVIGRIRFDIEIGDFIPQFETKNI